MTAPATDRVRCTHCGQVLRQYKQRARPVLDKVIAILTSGPATSTTIAAALDMRVTTMTNRLRQYEDLGVIERAGLESFTQTQTIPYGLRKRQQSVTMTHYRTLWRIKP